MRVHRAAELLMAEVQSLVRKTRRMAPNAVDHLERSTDSVLYNTAEGIGSFKPKMKAASYSVARREASEVQAILRGLVIKRVLNETEVRKAYELAATCIAMLTRLIIAHERRAAEN